MSPRLRETLSLLLPHVASAASMRFGFHVFAAATRASQGRESR